MNRLSFVEISSHDHIYTEKSFKNLQESKYNEEKKVKPSLEIGFFYSFWKKYKRDKHLQKL